MAGIDKTYVKTWEEFQAIKKWIDEHRYFKTNADYVVDLKYCVFDWPEESDFDGEKWIPVMSTSCLEDYFLIKYCDVPVFQERMKECYGEEELQAIKNGTSDFDTFTKEGKYGTKAKVIKRPRKVWNGKQYLGLTQPSGSSWWVDTISPEGMGFLDYNEELDRWFWPYEQGEGHTNVAFVKSFKGVIRKIRKWKLPKGTIVRLSGRYVGDEYELLIY